MRTQLFVATAAAAAFFSPKISIAQSNDAAVAPPPQDAPPVEITVSGQGGGGRRLQQSAEAVHVVELRRAKQQSADLGEVLARTQGVSVRRDGGLGSASRFSLNGLYDTQIRFFVDGVPLELAGYPFGIANVPVNLIERVEIYRGVVPIRFGADALGGAVNLVTDEGLYPFGSASYQVGSFGTHRLNVAGRQYHEPSGALVRAHAFLDSANNDYEVDVRVSGPTGELSDAKVRRFHDDYRAYGGSVEAGIVERSWAKRLLVRGFASGYDKELQNNPVMTVPYGEVRYDETVHGASARYDVDLPSGFSLQTLASYSRRATEYLDQSPWAYDWYGQRVFRRPSAGEVDGRPHDQTLWQDGYFARALLGWSPNSTHALRASFTPQYASRAGEDRALVSSLARDPLTAKRELFSLVSGLEYELALLEGRLSTVFFFKDYYYRATTDEVVPGNIFLERTAGDHSQGAGFTSRYRFTPWLLAKASYERATRLPSSSELFGNGVLIRENVSLEPEVSHNANVGPRLELKRQSFGDLTLDVNAFWRGSDRLIVLLGAEQAFRYENLYAARALGLENAGNWLSPGRLVSLEGSLTWLDLRNESTEGTFARFEGDRIPNRPYLFGSWGARLRLQGVTDARDTVEPFYYGRYVHGFFRGWESAGDRDYKQRLDSQVTHSVGATWSVMRDGLRATSTFEIDNVTDAKLFDNFGLQRPGRAFYLKVTGELR
ncbi:MAG: TonB-dependent receptor [Polyangiaceae bacterium]|nr:TonB-dependent receptor [Polyangiaceae bacterium]